VLIAPRESVGWLSARRADIGWLTFVLALCTVAGPLVVLTLSGLTLTHQQAVVIFGIAALCLVAVAATALVSSDALIEIRRTPHAIPVIVMAVSTSLFASGIGGVLPHQAAWGLIAVLFAAWAILSGSRLQRTAPRWLMLYAVLGLILELAYSWAFMPVLDIGLSVIALFVMWQIACSLASPGGVMRFLAGVAGAFWAVTVLAVLVQYSGAHVGSMSRSTITLPWEVPLGNLFHMGDYHGFGFVTTQAGREIAFVVCLYHFVRWRFTRRPLHAWLAAAAFLLFLTMYGRVPFVGGVLGLTIAGLTSRVGTPPVKVAAAAVFFAVFFVLSGATSKITAVSEANARTSALSFDSGHYSLWSQHLGLFAEAPLTGVGNNPTDDQIAKTWQQPVISTTKSLPQEELLARGSRGEGGWTGLLAQRGIVAGGIIVSLLFFAARFVFAAFPRDPDAQQDAVVLRAVIPASFVFYITDVAPMSIYSVTAYVVGQLTMMAAVRAIRLKKHAAAPRFRSQ
jgi:hypothetical protein